jgi:hypothetical protein
VIVTTDNVIPYRSKLKYYKEFILNRYFITEPGREKSGEYPDGFLGKFEILRVPKGLENTAVEPESGVIFQSRTDAWKKD